MDWTHDLPVIDFLRDIGKHFSVNSMIQRDSVKSRLERTNEGISYTEFSYMLLQAMDFLRLAQNEGCLLQIGGSELARVLVRLGEPRLGGSHGAVCLAQLRLEPLRLGARCDRAGVGLVPRAQLIARPPRAYVPCHCLRRR